MLYVVIGIYLVWLLVIFLAQDFLIFPGHAWKGEAAALDRSTLEIIELDTPGGKVPGIYVKGAGAGPESPRGLLVMLHGNAMRIEDWQDLAGRIAAEGVNVLVPEYRGYGLAEGKPSEKALVEDALAFIARVSRRPEVDADKVRIYGRSIGAALAAQVARRCNPSAVLLQTPPASIASYAWQYGAPPFLLRHPFRTDEALKAMPELPVTLVVHDDDEIVPAWQVERLRSIAPHAQFVLLKGDHNMLASSEEERRFARLLMDFACGKG
ncbi:MAG: alpha/beta fold hydrolase [Phycisphaerales bacterium]|nr:alpha/beta fold hydrolase [Phycisphaerales bacterium]